MCYFACVCVCVSLVRVGGCTLTPGAGPNGVDVGDSKRTKHA